MSSIKDITEKLKSVNWKKYIGVATNILSVIYDAYKLKASTDFKKINDFLDVELKSRKGVSMGLGALIDSIQKSATNYDQMASMIDSTYDGFKKMCMEKTSERLLFENVSIAFLCKIQSQLDAITKLTSDIMAIVSTDQDRSRLIHDASPNANAVISTLDDTNRVVNFIINTLGLEKTLFSKQTWVAIITPVHDLVAASKENADIIENRMNEIQDAKKIKTSSGIKEITKQLKEKIISFSKSVVGAIKNIILKMNVDEIAQNVKNQVVTTLTYLYLASKFAKDMKDIIEMNGISIDKEQCGQTFDMLTVKVTPKMMQGGWKSYQTLNALSLLYGGKYIFSRLDADGYGEIIGLVDGKGNMEFVYNPYLFEEDYSDSDNSGSESSSGSEPESESNSGSDSSSEEEKKSRKKNKKTKHHSGGKRKTGERRY